MEQLRIFILCVQLQFWDHSLSQAHSGVHSRLVFLHLYFVMQSFWHLQKTSSLQTLGASGSVVQRGSYILLVLIQPLSVGNCNVGAGIRAWTPDMSTLVYCSLDVLLQASICQWDQLDIALLCKQFVVSLVDIDCGAYSVRKQDDEPLDGVHGIFINMIWCNGKVSKCLGQLG